MKPPFASQLVADLEIAIQFADVNRKMPAGAQTTFCIGRALSSTCVLGAAIMLQIRYSLAFVDMSKRQHEATAKQYVDVT